MKKTFILVLFLFFIPSVDAYVELSVGDVRCNPDSTLTFSIKNNGDENLETAKAEVFIQKKEIGTPKKVSGDWDRVYFPKRDPKKEILTNFVSDMWTIDSPGDYVGKINYIYCKESLDITNNPICEADFKFACHSYDYACSLANPTIIDCYNKNDMFYLAFSNFSENKYEELDYKNYLGFRFVGKERIWWESDFPEDFVIDNLGKDKYAIRFPLKGETIEEVKIENKRCKVYDYTSKCEVRNDDIKAQQETEEKEQTKEIAINQQEGATEGIIQEKTEIKDLPKERPIQNYTYFIAIIILLLLIIVFLIFKSSIIKNTRRLCPHCQNSISKGDKFCEKCGGRIN